ncbi:MAG TPA: N-acetylneuraminate synthase family protein [Gemmatimonadales bacterium]|nr:N-acetylneuraminate synthase family protein [Gemmatimonadales bacterium]
MTSRTLKIDGIEISDASDSYVIAEIGHNHQGKLDTALELFRAAKQAGVDAVKLQKRDNRALYTRAMYEKPYDHENSFGATYGAHREALEFGRGEYSTMVQYAKELGIALFATAFDFPSVDFLADLEMPAYKVASGDLKNIPLLKYVASVKKPMIISTGAATLEDVRRAYDAVQQINQQVCLLQCTAAYPVEFSELDLRVISTYRDEFPDAVVGLSAHDNGIAMAVAAFVLGARVIEKHFTLNRAMKGTDHAFSLEPVGLRKLVRDLKRARVALGDGKKKMYASEQGAYLKMAKKLVATRDLPAGHQLTGQDIALRSPGDGIPPCDLDRVMGRILKVAIREDEGFAFEMLDGVAPRRDSGERVSVHYGARERAPR